MTEIECKALALLNECAGQEVYCGWGTFDPDQSPCTRALCRAIEQHEAFRQEVSDAVEKLLSWPSIRSQGIIVDCLASFIIAKPDPLVAVMIEALSAMGGTYTGKELTPAFRAALAKRGLEIREKSE